MKRDLPYFVRLALALVTATHAQVQTETPPPVAGAKPVSVEHIKVHGEALEGNLERNAVDRDVFVFLPPQQHQRDLSPVPSAVRVTRLFDRS